MLSAADRTRARASLPSTPTSSQNTYRSPLASSKRTLRAQLVPKPVPARLEVRGDLHITRGEPADKGPHRKSLAPFAGGRLGSVDRGSWAQVELRSLGHADDEHPRREVLADRDILAGGDHERPR